MFGASFVSLHSHNALAAGTEIPSRLECSATSEHPERNRNQRYSLQVSFIFNNNSLQGEPATRRHPGKEVYSGSVGPNRVTAVMLQPPCRVMLGSDPCQSSLSK